MKRLFIDGHNDTMMRVIDQDTWEPVVDIGGATDFHIDLEKLKEGGLLAPVFAAFSEGYYEGGQNIARSLSESLAILNALYYTEEKNQGKFKIVATVEEIRENFKNGLISAIPSIEGAYFIDEDNYMEILRQLRDLGVKILGFNWNYSNYLGEGAGEVYSDQKTRSSGGLTDLGKLALKEMENLGIGIDVSHMNEETFWGVVENTTSPIIASHSGVYELRNHRRNLKDDQLEAIKESGGLVGVVLCNGFLKEGGDAYLKDYMDHIDYIINKIGIDHVAIGSDLDGADLPKDLKDSSEMGKIVKLLEGRYGDEEVEKILSGNFLRVFERLESKANQVYVAGETRLNYSMGEGIKGRLLRASLGWKGARTRLILDGIEMDSFKNDSDIFEFKIDLVSQEKFHILTIEQELAGKITRATKIIRI